MMERDSGSKTNQISTYDNFLSDFGIERAKDACYK